MSVCTPQKRNEIIDFPEFIMSSIQMFVGDLGEREREMERGREREGVRDRERENKIEKDREREKEPERE